MAVRVRVVGGQKKTNKKTPRLFDSIAVICNVRPKTAEELITILPRVDHNKNTAYLCLGMMMHPNVLAVSTGGTLSRQVETLIKELGATLLVSGKEESQDTGRISRDHMHNILFLEWEEKSYNESIGKVITELEKRKRGS